MTHRTISSNDPMSDKYPNMSPYNYCANNPVILVDLDGSEIDPTSQGAKIAKSAATEFLKDSSKNPNNIKK